MRFLIVLSLFSMNALAADINLSAGMVKRLDVGLSSSALQLAMPGPCRLSDKSEQYKKKFFAELASDAGKFPLTVVGGALVAGAMGIGLHHGSAYQGAYDAFHYHRDQNLALKLANNARNAARSAGVLATVGMGSLLVGVAKDSKSNVDAPHVLNADRLNTFAKETARESAEIFRLEPDEEATLRGSIKSAIMKKHQAKEETSFDYYEVLMAANFRGQPVLRGEVREVFEEMHRAGAGKADAKELSNLEKVSSFFVMNLALASCMDSGDLSSARRDQIKKVMAKNTELLKDIYSWTSLKRKPESSEPASKESSLDAE